MHYLYYYPDDVDDFPSSLMMERKEFNAMIKEIFAKGEITEIYVPRHTGEDGKTYYEWGKVVAVKITEPTNINYTIHFNGLTPMEVVEEVL